MVWSEKLSGMLYDSCMPMRIKGRYKERRHTEQPFDLPWHMELNAGYWKSNTKIHYTTQRWRCSGGVTRLNHVRNTRIRGTLKLRPISHKLQKSRSSGYGYVVRRRSDHMTRKVLDIINKSQMDMEDTTQIKCERARQKKRKNHNPKVHYVHTSTPCKIWNNLYGSEIVEWRNLLIRCVNLSLYKKVFEHLNWL